MGTSGLRMIVPSNDESSAENENDSSGGSDG
jgi:hypothetical protein